MSDVEPCFPALVRGRRSVVPLPQHRPAHPAIGFSAEHIVQELTATPPNADRTIATLMRLLLVEDDTMIGKSLQKGLKQDGYAVDWVRDGQAADAALEGNSYSLVLLDLGLPKLDGRAVLTNLRRRKQQVPVLVITARDAVSDRVGSLDAGADDYIVKPFSFEELGARIRAVLRRHAGSGDPLLQHGALTVNPVSHDVWLDSRAVHLSAKEYGILEALLRRPGIPLSRAQLEDSIYGWGEEIASNSVEVHIHSLRRKLGAQWIESVRGVGYRIGRSS